MMRERSKGRSQEQAAAKANVKSRQTVAKYEQLGEMPSGLKGPRVYRTREDPFVEDWAELEEMLIAAPELEAKALFDWLCEQKGDKYQEGQLRTLQRRVSDWRALNVAQVAVLEQIHRPGEIMQTDGTWLNQLGVTIQGIPLKAVLIHSVLTYSNWEWGRLARSESLAALQLGIQSTLFKLGYVPVYHQTDHSTAATYRLGAMAREEREGEERGYTAGYLQLLEHYGLQPRVIHVGAPQENGDIESSNGGLKRSLEQHLLLRGSRDFASVSVYEGFIQGVMDKRNRARQKRLAEELAVMKPLRATALATGRQEEVPVSRGSLIRVLNNTYSVPTSLKGKKVTVYIYEWWLEVYYGRKLMETLPRLSGRDKHQINYRHLIDSLLRKPGGFRNYRYREELFPRLIFRQAWEQLDGWYAPRKADLIYLRVLNLAARTLESEVACGLELLVQRRERWDETDLEQLLQPGTTAVPQLSPPAVSLAQYDQLLPGVAYVSP
jgi:transposase InsO family protein